MRPSRSGVAGEFRPKRRKAASTGSRNGVGDGFGDRRAQSDRLRLEQGLRQGLRHGARTGGLRGDRQRPRSGAAGGDGAGGDPAALGAQREAAIPAGRFGAPEEFGALCAFLCGARAGYLTGQNILIDGGAFPGAF
jgi:hypothetical protein